MPNCMMRGSPVMVVIRPNVPDPKLAFGRPQLKVLNSVEHLQPQLDGPRCR
jgi:hypothetical protein